MNDEKKSDKEKIEWLQANGFPNLAEAIIKAV